MLTRISDLAEFNQTQSLMRTVQARMHDTQIQISTGKKAQRYEGLAEDSTRLVNLKADRSAATRFVENNKVIDQRLATMEDKVAGLIELATSYKAFLVNAANASNAADMAFATHSQAELDRVAGLLNTRVDGRYLFSGSRTDVAPVNLGAAGFTTPPTTYPSDPNTAYYEGDDTALAARADHNLTVTYGVNADSPEFEKLIRALHLGATTSVTPTIERDRIQESLRLVNEVLDSLPDVRTRIGAARHTLESTNQRHSDFLLYADQSIGEIEDVDPVEAVNRLNADQTHLQASYMVVARLAQISLADYLR